MISGYLVGELDIYIRELHAYNELKDIGQMLLGKLGVLIFEDLLLNLDLMKNGDRCAIL